MGGGKLMAILHFINVYGTIIMMPIAFFALLPWPVRDIGLAIKRKTGKDNFLMKFHMILMKVHIPLGVYVLVVGIFHTIFASINHGWGFNWEWSPCSSICSALYYFFCARRLAGSGSHSTVLLNMPLSHACSFIVYPHCLSSSAVLQR